MRVNVNVMDVSLCLIDDDVIYQFLYKKILESLKSVQNLMIFSNGKEAIDFFNKNVNKPQKIPDIVFLDLNMPIMDGWQFLEELIPIKSLLTKNIVIYIITSSEHPDDISRASYYTDVTGYLVKPITADKFREIIELNSR